MTYDAPDPCCLRTLKNSDDKLKNFVKKINAFDSENDLDSWWGDSIKPSLDWFTTCFGNDRANIPSLKYITGENFWS